MSGGSFNYLYCKECYDLINNDNSGKSDLESMINYVNELADKCEQVHKKGMLAASTKLQAILNKVETLKKYIDSQVDIIDEDINKSKELMYKVEWECSQDIGIEDVYKETDKLA